jgi:pimeloyl-ACP methyl ester carboxylesterase
MRLSQCSVVGVGLVVAALVSLSEPVVGEAVKVVVPQRLSVEVAGRQLQIAYTSSAPIDQANNKIDRAVIVIHGINRDADVYLESMLRAAKQTATADARTIIVAPQFLNHEDAAAHQLPNGLPVWRGSAWTEGDDSEVDSKDIAAPRISSYTVVDRLVEKLADEALFPKLRSVVVAGHSAGGQFINRYAAGNRFDEKLSRERRLRVRYVIANPSSYLYFDEQRPVLGSAGKFAKPTAEQIKQCPGYNDYRYGMEKLNGYMQAVGPDQLRSQYAQREVVYLLGAEDTDPNHASLSKTCAAEMQGRHRLERGQLYHAHLRKFFGQEIAKRHRVQLVPGVGHNSLKMFSSPGGVRCLFEAAVK